MLINDFSGGLNKRLAPNLLQGNEAQIYQNINNEQGSLIPIKDSTLDTSTVDTYFTWYYANGEFIASSTESSFVEYRDILYQTNLNSYPTKYDGTDTTRLGIEAPSLEVIPENSYSVILTDFLATSLPKGTYKYRIKKTVSDGTNDIITVYETEHTITDYSTITVETGIPSGTVEIYREFDGIYRLAGTTTIANFDDTVYDISGLAEWVEVVLSTYNYLYTYYDINSGNESAPSPISIEVSVSTEIGTEFNQAAVTVNNLIASLDSQVTNIRLYRIGGLLTEYTLLVELDNIDTSYVDERTSLEIAGSHILDSIESTVAPDNLKYLHSSYAMLFGTVGDKLYYSDIAKPTVWPVTNFIDFEDDITAIGAIQNGLIVCTLLKTYLITGNSPSTFSKYLLDGEQGCVSHYTMQFTANALIWLSQDGICTTSGGIVQILSQTKLGKLTLQGVKNSAVHDRVYYVAHADGILAFDFRYNQIVATITTNVNWLGNYKDTLYSNIDGNIHEMFSGDNLTYFYKSPMLVEGSYSMRKDYKDFYIKYNGDVELKIYVDGELVNTKVLSGDDCYNLKALAKSSGYGLEITLEGTAIISEIEYKAQGRQNGR